MRYRLVLDTGAVLAYARGSIGVGEVLTELADEAGPRFAVPAVAMLEAAVQLDKPDERRLLDLLATHRYGVVLSFGADDWRDTAPAVDVFGSAGRACAALAAAYGLARYVMTPDPARYEAHDLDVVPVGWPS